MRERPTPTFDNRESEQSTRERQERGERAGKNLWLLSGLHLEIVENTIDLADLDPIVNGLQPEFGQVQINRRVAGPMAGGLYPEYALLAILSAAATVFLQEAVKDAYKGLRAGLYAAYKKARSWANDRGYSPLGFSVPTEDDSSSTEGKPGKVIFYTFREGLSQEQFETAFKAFAESVGKADTSRAEFYVELELNPAADDWEEARSE